MKRNLVFIGVILSLLTYIFFFIEKEERNSYEEKKKKEQIINFSKLGSLKSLKTKTFSIKLGEDERYYSQKSNLLLNDEVIDYLFSELLKIKVLRKLDVNDFSLYLPKDPLKLEFSFEKGNLIFYLGNRVEVGAEFYLKIVDQGKESLVLCKKEGAFSTQSEKDKVSAPYNNFKSLISIKDEALYEKRPLKYFQSIKKIALKNFRNSLYSIDLEVSKINYNYKFKTQIIEKKIKRYKENLFKLSAKRIIKEKGSLKDEIGHITVNDINLTVFKKFNDEIGYFLQFKDLVFEIDSYFFRSIFAHPQDFIDKKLGAQDIILNNSGFEDKKLMPFLQKDAYMLSPVYELNKDNLKLIRTDIGDIYLKDAGNEVIFYNSSKMIAYHFLEKLK